MNTFSEKQRQFYNSSAKKYDNRSFGVYQRANRNHYKKIEKILSIVKKYIPKKILEVGTGTGIHAQWLLKKTKGKISYWGIDISEEMLKASKENLFLNVSMQINYLSRIIFLIWFFVPGLSIIWTNLDKL